MAEQALRRYGDGLFAVDAHTGCLSYVGRASDLDRRQLPDSFAGGLPVAHAQAPESAAGGRPLAAPGTSAGVDAGPVIRCTYCQAALGLVAAMVGTCTGCHRRLPGDVLRAVRRHADVPHYGDLENGRDIGITPPESLVKSGGMPPRIEWRDWGARRCPTCDSADWGPTGCTDNFHVQRSEPREPWHSRFTSEDTPAWQPRVIAAVAMLVAVVALGLALAALGMGIAAMQKFAQQAASEVSSSQVGSPVGAPEMGPAQIGGSLQHGLGS